MARLSRSPLVRVTLRNCSDRVPTSPATHLFGPFACTVSTRIGSLNNGPVRICPSRRTRFSLIFASVVEASPSDPLPNPGLQPPFTHQHQYT
jgi:hypothetical protein